VWVVGLGMAPDLRQQDGEVLMMWLLSQSNGMAIIG
jgi:hypothetical protein